MEGRNIEVGQSCFLPPRSVMAGRRTLRGPLLDRPLPFKQEFCGFESRTECQSLMYTMCMSLASELRKLMADVVVFYFQAHGCHWNVEGQDFSQYHSLFSDIYDDVYGSIDPIAENIRKLGEYAPFNPAVFVDESSIDFRGVATDPKGMANYLRDSNEKVITQVNAALKAAVAENEQGIANFLADRDDRHKKWRWQLNASLK